MCFYWWLYCGCGAVETGATETRWYIYYMQCLVLVHSNAHTRSYSRFGWKHARSWKRITQQVSRIISSWVWETKKLLELLLRRMQFFFREVSRDFSGVMRLLSYIRAEILGTYNNYRLFGHGNVKWRYIQGYFSCSAIKKMAIEWICLFIHTHTQTASSMSHSEILLMLAQRIRVLQPVLYWDWIPDTSDGLFIHQGNFPTLIKGTKQNKTKNK
jgi:hypothetical protein